MKKIAALLLSLALIFSLAACGTKAPAPAPADAAETDPATTDTPQAVLGSEPVEITFWHCASDDAGVLMDKYIADFNANNEYNITVNAIYQGQYSDATTLLNTMLSGENYDDLPDLMQLDATGKTTYFSSGKAFTVDDAVAAYGGDLGQYLEAALSNWQLSGVHLGLPFATSTTVTFYNKTLLDEAGFGKVPDTFADLIELAAAMKDKGMEQKILTAVPNTPTLANWLGQLGSYVVDNNNGAEGTATQLDCIDNGALATFLTEWKAMYDAGALANENASADAFIAGDVVIAPNSSSNVNRFLEAIDGKFEIGVTSYLRVNDSADYGATVAGSCLVMFDSADELRKQAAWYFMQYLTSAETQADFAANTGYIPSNKGALEDPAYVAVTEAHPEYLEAYDQLANTPADMRSVTVGPSTDFYYAIMQDVSDMLEYNQSVEETVQIMQDDLNALLDEYLRNN